MNTHLEFKTGITKKPCISPSQITASNKVRFNFLNLKELLCIYSRKSESPMNESVSSLNAKHVAYLPVKVITDVFKVGEKRHWAEEARQLIPCHRGEAAVFKGTGDIQAQRTYRCKKWFRKQLSQASIRRANRLIAMFRIWLQWTRVINIF